MAGASWFWFQRRDWIVESLKIFGFINRDHIQRKFGISRPQASADLARIQREDSGLMIYNPSTKRYEPTRRFEDRKGSGA